MGNNFNSIKLGSTQFDFRPYTTCTTGATDATKVVSVANFSLFNGASVTVKFSNKNNVANPKLNVTNTGAKSIYYNGVALPSTQYWEAGAVIEFIYDGTNWNVNGAIKDNNTTYSAATASASGLVSTGNQTFGGIKTFSSGLIVNSSIEGSPYSILLESNNTHSYKIEAYDTTSENNTGIGLYIGTDRGLDIVGAGGLAINVGSAGGGYGTSGQVLKSNGSSVYWASDNNTIYSAGTGISISSNTISAKLRSTTALTIDSSAATTTSGRVYPVVPDKSGYLSVNVPWSDTNTKATQNSTTTNGNFPLLLKYTNNSTNETNTIKYGIDLTYNPSTKLLNVNNINISGELKSDITQSAGYSAFFNDLWGETLSLGGVCRDQPNYLSISSSDSIYGVGAGVTFTNLLVEEGTSEGFMSFIAQEFWFKNYNDTLATIRANIPGRCYYANCTAANTAAIKTVSITDFPSEISEGTSLIIYFSNSNNASKPVIKVNGGANIPIIYGTSSNFTWTAGVCIPFVYIGDAWRIVGKWA